MLTATLRVAGPRCRYCRAACWHNSFLHFVRGRLPAVRHSQQMAGSIGLFLA